MKPLDQSYSKSRRFKNQVKAVVTNPYNVIVLVAIVLLTYLIVLPLVDMLSTTFQLAQRILITGISFCPTIIIITLCYIETTIKAFIIRQYLIIYFMSISSLEKCADIKALPFST